MLDLQNSTTCILNIQSTHITFYPDRLQGKTNVSGKNWLYQALPLLVLPARFALYPETFVTKTFVTFVSGPPSNVCVMFQDTSKFVSGPPSNVCVNHLYLLMITQSPNTLLPDNTISNWFYLLDLLCILKHL